MLSSLILTLLVLNNFFTFVQVLNILRVRRQVHNRTQPQQSTFVDIRSSAPQELKEFPAALKSTRSSADADKPA